MKQKSETSEGLVVYPVTGICPVCGGTLTVTRLHCRHCDSALEGQFSLGRFYHLTPEQQTFVETFLRCEGKISWVQEEMGLSYPAVRSRLEDVIRALGYEVRPEHGGEQFEDR
ncbi:MAG: DUF2089 domain-containing protein, partial [Candidatus Sigynarchaeota archaeon]